MRRLDGKTALITGAARGIGLAFARAYVAEGARVAIADVNIGAAERASAGLGPAAVAIRMDVTEQASIEAAVAAADSALGGIDILINNAALFTAAPIAEITRADYDRIFAVNVAGALFTLQAVARGMIARGRGGKIINMASQAGRRGEALVAAYCASKAAVGGLTRTLALELGKFNITANYVCPGAIYTGMTQSNFDNPEIRAVWEKKAALRRLGQPIDIARGALLLASDEADFITGHELVVDGGLTLRT